MFLEIKDILQDPTESITIEKLNQLKYLERVIKESLRLYPSVVMIGRIIHEELQLCMIFYLFSYIENHIIFIY